MSTTNREIVTAWFDQVWNAGDEAAIDRLMAPSAKLHGLKSSTEGPVVGPEGFKPFYHVFRQAFPDIRIRAITPVSMRS